MFPGAHHRLIISGPSPAHAPFFSVPGAVAAMAHVQAVGAAYTAAFQQPSYLQTSFQPPQPFQPPSLHRQIVRSAPVLGGTISSVGVIPCDGNTVLLRYHHGVLTIPEHRLYAGQSVDSLKSVLEQQIGFPPRFVKHFDITHHGYVTRDFIMPSHGMSSDAMTCTMISHRMPGKMIRIPLTSISGQHAYDNRGIRYRLDDKTADALAYLIQHLHHLM